MQVSKIVSLVSLVGLAACTTVRPGYVGVLVDNYGKNRGVQDYPIVTGRVFYNPVSQDVIEYPTFVQTVKWTKGKTEGSDKDESFTFNSTEGATLNVDIGASVSFDGNKVPALFVKFRKDPETIIDGYIRNQIRKAFSTYASRMKVVDIMGSGKQMLQDSVTSSLNKEFLPDGIIVDNVSIIGTIRADEQVEKSINAVLTATQIAIAAENKVKQAQAEAEQQVATAKGDSAAAVIEAQGKSQANVILARSVTPELVEYQKVQAWDGHLPQVSGVSPLVNFKQP